MQKSISISILDAKNIPNFLEELKTYKKNEDCFENWIHFDVMDGKFVNNTGIDLKYIKTAKNMGFYTDTHLMVEKPLGDKYIDKAIEYGTDIITIHYEISNFNAVLNRLVSIKKELYKTCNRELKIGVSIKPNTDVKELKKYSDMFDLLLIMSVESGYGGQSYIYNTNEKISIARRLFKDKIIQVDGGVNLETIETPLSLNVDSFVVGSYLTKNDAKDNLLKLNILKYLTDLPKDGNLEFDKKLLMIVPGGYGENDTLLGISVPTMRKAARVWYKDINLTTLTPYISSKYHDYRRFAIFCMSNIVKKYYSKNEDKKIKDVVDFMCSNVSYINNWDLTDEAGPNILGFYLMSINISKAKEEVLKFVENDNIWIKRIGIVSLLTMARNNKLNFCIDICKNHMYNENHLIQKAIGWVLREVYKKDSKKIVDLLKDKNSKKKLPTILLSYACERMSSIEKNSIKNN